MLLDNKTLSLLAFCHYRLKEAEKQKNIQSSTQVLDTKEDENFIDEMALTIISFCEDIRATKKGIEDRVIFHPSLKVYYNFIVDYYQKQFSNGTYHIPFLFVLGVIRELKQQNLINLNLSYDYALSLFEEAKVFNSKQKPSRIVKNKMINDRSEIFKYEIMVREVLDGVWKLSLQINSIKKRNKRNKRNKRKKRK